MLVKLTPAVNFINVLRRQKITKPNVTREIRFCIKKRVLKMLVKLSPGEEKMLFSSSL
jgi:hypothetical protein